MSRKAPAADAIGARAGSGRTLRTGTPARWGRWPLIPLGLIALWGVAALLVTQFALGINLPVLPPSARFLSSESGRVVDVGAGSGRATIGLPLARPRVTVTAVDIYAGYFGIDDNTPERLLANARIAGVAGRVAAKVGDARELPLETGAYDGVISVAAPVRSEAAE